MTFDRVIPTQNETLGPSISHSLLIIQTFTVSTKDSNQKHHIALKQKYTTLFFHNKTERNSRVLFPALVLLWLELNIYNEFDT